MDLREKEKLLKMSCQKLLEEEMKDLSKNIDFEIDKQIKNELEEYQKKEELAYHKKIEKLDKDYNKQIYQLEMDCKKEILNVKKNLQKNVKREIEEFFKKFALTTDYENFLMTRINQCLKKVAHTNVATLGITEQDKKKYGNQIQEKYQVKLKTIESKAIGGCVLEDNSAGIYIDFTIQNSIHEKLEKNELG